MPRPTVFTINSWNELLPTIAGIRAALNYQQGEECFFRGHANGAWSLLPTLFRMDLTPSRRAALEDTFFWEFQARAHELHPQQLDDWEYLFAMRHHGMPTRLLDWTESLAIALYFAVLATPDSIDAPCIWVLNPYELNLKAGWGRDVVAPKYLGWQPWKTGNPGDGTYYTYGDMVAEREDGIDWKWPCAIYPMQRIARMRAQKGWFTIHGTNPKPIDEIAPQCLARIDFVGQSVTEAQQMLSLLGIDAFSVMADLDSLSATIVEKNLKDLYPSL